MVGVSTRIYDRLNLYYITVWTILSEYPLSSQGQLEIRGFGSQHKLFSMVEISEKSFSLIIQSLVCWQITEAMDYGICSQFPLWNEVSIIAGCPYFDNTCSCKVLRWPEIHAFQDWLLFPVLIDGLYNKTEKVSAKKLFPLGLNWDPLCSSLMPSWLS